VISNEATFVFWHSLYRAPARSSVDERRVPTEAADPECYRLGSGATPARFSKTWRCTWAANQQPLRAAATKGLGIHGVAKC
jgi:hypothetical protein